MPVSDQVQRDRQGTYGTRIGIATLEPPRDREGDRFETPAVYLKAGDSADLG